MMIMLYNLAVFHTIGKLSSFLGKRHLANGRMTVNQQGIGPWGWKLSPSPCTRREIRTRQAGANLM